MLHSQNVRRVGHEDDRNPAQSHIPKLSHPDENLEHRQVFVWGEEYVARYKGTAAACRGAYKGEKIPRILVTKRLHRSSEHLSAFIFLGQGSSLVCSPT
jgi:hypothetical protein